MVPVIDSQVLFNTNSLQLTFSDDTNYSSYGIALANVLGNLKCTGPTGIFHNGNSWVSPDLTLSTGNVLNVTLPSLNGVIYSGSYTFDYTIQVVSNIAFTRVSPFFNNVFSTPSDVTSIITAGDIFVISSGPNAGTYTVTSAAWDGSVTTLVLTQPAPDAAAGFTATFTNYYTESQTFPFTDCTPVVTLDLTSDCDCSQITSQDLSNYTINIGGNYYAPTSTSRVHTVYPPVSPSTGNRVAGTVTSSDATIIVTPSWTTVWTSTVQTALIYNIDGLIVQKTVSGSARLDVECSSELCCAFQCIKNIYDTWIDLKEKNPAKAKDWETKVIAVSMQWVIYSLATQCGRTTDAENAISVIIAITKAAGCNCCDDNSAEPAQIVSICGAVSGTGSGANARVITCGNGITVTPTTVGNTTTYQICLDIDILEGIIQDYLDTEPIGLNDLNDVTLTSLGSGDLLRFNGVDFVNVSQISMSQIIEFQITSPTIGQVIKWNGSKFVNAANTGDLIAVEQNTYTNVGTSTQTVKTVTLPLGTFAQAGDLISIESQFTVSADTNNKQVYISMDGVDFVTSAYLNATGIRRVLVNAKIIRVSSTQVRVEYYFKLYGTFAGYAFPDYGSSFYYADPTLYTVNNMDTLASALQFRVVPTVGASTISLVNYTVTSFKK